MCRVFQLLACFFLLVNSVHANSNGYYIKTCDAFGAHWGCKKFANINERNRNVKGKCCFTPGGPTNNRPENQCGRRCCDENPGIMFWTEAPKWDKTMYAVRSGNQNPANDPAVYTPGGIQHIYVHVLKRDAKFRGLLMNAVATEHDNKIIGEWVFPSGVSDPRYQVSPKCPQSAVHLDSSEKPYTNLLRWKAPSHVDGKPVGRVHFQALLKRGGANHGEFFWSELLLDQAAPVTAQQPLNWTVSTPRQSCTQVCATQGLHCWPESLQNVKIPADLAPITKHMAAQGKACALPLLAGCAPLMGGKADRCYYRENKCGARSIGCNTALVDDGMLCPCGTEKGYRVAYPGGRGVDTDGTGGTGTDTDTDTGTGTDGTGTSEEVDSAPAMRKAGLLPLALLLLASVVVARGRLAVVTVVTMLLLANWAEAHNWAHSEFRYRRQAQGRKPCPPRVPGRFGVQVGPQQDFTVAWATGHGHDVNILVVRADKLHLVGGGAGPTNTVNQVKKIIDEAPATGNLRDQKWKRQHGASGWGLPKTTDSDKYMTEVPETSEYYHISQIVKQAEPGTKIFKIADERLQNDKYVSYKHSTMDHITHAGVFPVSEINFSEFDQIRMSMPDWAEPGHYVLIWDWQGYGDCLDIELRKEKVAHPYGKGDGKFKWERIEHCQLAKPFKKLVGTCHQAKPTVEACFDDIDKFPLLNVDSVGTPGIGINDDNLFDYKRIGINVIPIMAAGTINSMLTRSDGASIDAPFDKEWNKRYPDLVGSSDSYPKGSSKPLLENVRPTFVDRCLVGGPLDLDGTTTTSDDKWEAEWRDRAEETTQKCSGRRLFDAPSLKEAVQLCTSVRCQGIAANADGTYSGCAEFAAPGGEACPLETKTKPGCDQVHACCCAYTRKYDMVPFITWGKTPVSEQGWFTRNDCDTVVGGTKLGKCPYVCTAPPTGETRPPLKSYRKKAAFRAAKSDLAIMMGATYERLVTVSFQPADAKVNKLPANTVVDSGEVFGDRGGGWKYGWTGCKHKHFRSMRKEDPSKNPTDTVENTHATFISELCPTEPRYEDACTRFTDKYKGDLPFKLPTQCKRNTWEIKVDNGWYKIATNVYARERRGKKASSCAIEGWSLTIGMTNHAGEPQNTNTQMQQMKGLFAQPLDEKNSYYNWVEVTDGRLTFEDHSTSGNSCDHINAITIFKLKTGAPSVSQGPTWFPQQRDPWVQRQFVARRKIGVVSFEAPNDDCRHAWLLHGGKPKCMTMENAPTGKEFKQLTLGWFPASGPVVGVSDTPCTDGGCLKGTAGVDYQICGRVDKSRSPLHGEGTDKYGGYVEQVYRLPDTSAGLRNKYWVDCKGKEGKYVFVMAPGSGRILPITNLIVNQDGPAVGDPAEFKNKFMCFPVEARQAAEHTPEYITSDDPEDTVFYSTCFMREANVVYLPPEGKTVTPDSKYEFVGKCLPCDLYEKNRSPTLAVPNRWEFVDVCRNCKAQRDAAGTCAAGTCAAP